MAYFIGTMIPFVVIGFVIRLFYIEYKRNKELGKLAQRNRDIIFREIEKSKQERD